MREIVGDLWSQEADAICITTNGIVKANGEAVMGRGVALQAKRRYPGIAKTIGGMILCHGGTRVLLIGYSPALLTFPTKRHWRDQSDLLLIAHSADQVVRMADRMGYQTVILPRPGCGNGGLLWEDVRPVLTSRFDQRFSIISPS